MFNGKDKTWFPTVAETKRQAYHAGFFLHRNRTRYEYAISLSELERMVKEFDPNIKKDTLHFKTQVLMFLFNKTRSYHAARKITGYAPGLIVEYLRRIKSKGLRKYFLEDILKKAQDGIEQRIEIACFHLWIDGRVEKQVKNGENYWKYIK